MESESDQPIIYASANGDANMIGTPWALPLVVAAAILYWVPLFIIAWWTTR